MTHQPLPPPLSALPVTDATVSPALPLVCLRFTLLSYVFVAAAVTVMLMGQPLLLSAGLWFLATLCWWACKKKAQHVRFSQWSAHLAPLDQDKALAMLNRPDIPGPDRFLIMQWLRAYRLDWVSVPAEVLANPDSPDGQAQSVEGNQAPPSSP